MEVMNPGNGENLTLLDVQRRAIMINELYVYYDARYRAANCCPGSATKAQLKEGRDNRSEFEVKYQRIVQAKLNELAVIYTEELGKPPP